MKSNAYEEKEIENDRTVSMVNEKRADTSEWEKKAN